MEAKDKIKQVLTEAGLEGVEVVIGSGFESRTDGSDLLQINLSGDALEKMSREDIDSKVRKALGKLEPLAKHVEFDQPEVHIAKMRRELELFIEKGAKIPKEYLNWRGFDAKANKDDDEVYVSGTANHAVIASSDKSGVYVHIKLPVDSSDIDKETALGGSKYDHISKNIADRIPEIKALLVERLSKYFGAKDDAAKESIRSAVANLTFNVEGNSIHIRSPEQNAEMDRMKDPKAEKLSPEAENKIAETNILSRLTQEQLGKALGRAFLHGGAKADEIFPVIAGREDMKRAITRQLKLLKYSEVGQKDPELAKAVDTFLNDDMFKKHGWGERNRLKSTPGINKSADPDKKGMVHVHMDLPKNTAQQVLTEISALDAPAPADVAAAEQALAAATPAPDVTPASLASATPSQADALKELLAAGPQAPGARVTPAELTRSA